MAAYAEADPQGAEWVAKAGDPKNRVPFFLPECIIRGQSHLMVPFPFLENLQEATPSLLNE